MSFAEEPGIRMLNRIYCYLRLSGVAEEAARAHLREAAAALEGAPSADALWRELHRRVSAADACGELAEPELEAPPQVERGHVHYPET